MTRRELQIILFATTVMVLAAFIAVEMSKYING